MPKIGRSEKSNTMILKHKEINEIDIKKVIKEQINDSNQKFNTYTRKDTRLRNPIRIFC